MKRWLGVLMAFCMLFTLIPSQVFAADAPTVTIGNAEVTLGSATVSVPVSAAKLEKVSGLIIRVSFPTNALAVKEGAVAYEPVFESQLDNSKNAKSPLQISWNAGSVKEVTYDGKLCDINFDVLDTAKAGDYNITVEIYDAAVGSNDITDDVQVVNGTVTIKGSDTPEPKDVTITYAATPTEGGTVSGATTAKEGAEVTVTATPNENYKLVKIMAGDTEVKDNKFTVPTGVTSLTVTATFEKMTETPELKDVTIVYVASPTEGGTVSGVTTAKEGAEVTVTATPNENYKLVKIMAGDTEVKDNKFTVPTGVSSVTVTATFEQDETEQPEIIYPVLTIGNAEATIGTDKTVAVTVSAKSLDKVAGLIIQVTYPEGLSVKEGAVAYKNAFESQNDNAKDGKNPVQIAWNAGSAKSVTYEGELCTITFDVLDTAKAGTYDITAKVTDAALNGGTDITDNVKVTNGTLTMKGGATPEPKDVAITYVATPTEGGTVSGATTAKEGAEVTVTATPNENYKLVKVMAGDTEVTGGKFTVPTGVTSLTVTATFEKSETEQPEILYPALTIGSAEVTLGTDKTVAVPVSVKSLNKVAGLIIQVTYPEGLSVKEGAVAYKDAFESQNDNAKDGKNPVQIAWNAGSAKEVTYEGELCTITFDVLDTAKAGTYDITAKVTDAALNGGADITDNVTVTKGTLTIKDGGGTPTPTPVTEYEIEYATAEHGKISGATKSAADKDVAVTVEPDNGYKLDKLTVNGKDITGTTFKMPAEKVKVTATFVEKSKTNNEPTPGGNGGGGCYIATSVYGSYDTPEVWTLRRFRDDVLGQTWYGRLFIKTYYAISPTVVRLFGNAEWFQNFWRDKLDTLVQNLQDDGFESTPYQDKDW